VPRSVYNKDLYILSKLHIATYPNVCVIRKCFCVNIDTNIPVHTDNSIHSYIAKCLCNPRVHLGARKATKKVSRRERSSAANHACSTG